MKKIDKEEMFGNLKSFLKTKGIELEDGTYTRRLQKGCGLLTDSVNLSQETLKRAKTGIDKKLDELRQVIHEKTAPKPPVQPKQAAAGPAKTNAPMTAAKKPSARKPKAHARRG